MKKQNLLIITNLYPLPWEPNRATFNKQQFKLLKDDYNVHICVPIAWPDYFKNKAKLVESENISYFPYFYTPKIGRRYYAKMMEISFNLFSSLKIKAFSPDKLLSAWAFPEGVMGQSIANKLNIPFYLKVHGSDINGHGDIGPRAKQITFAANNSQGILSVSRALKEKMTSMGVDKEKVNVIYNGVDKGKFFPSSDPQEDHLLYVGNLKSTKGVIELLNAFSLVAKDYPKTKLVYVGSGGMLSQLRELASKHGLTNRVLFYGSIDHSEIPALMRQSRCIVLPSYAEGVPNVLLESMSCGTPVVATNVGGIPEVVIEGETGYTCEPKSAEKFAQALRKALSKKWDKEVVVEHAKQFDWKKNKEQLLKMLKR